MKQLAVFLVLLSWTTGSSQSCISTEEPLQESLADFDEDAFEELITSLIDTTDIDDGPCRVRIEFDYHQDSLTLSFTEHIEDSELDVEQIVLQTLLQPLDGEDVSFINAFEYACTGDKCEKKFLMEIVTWLQKFQYMELQNKAMPFLKINILESGE